MLNYDREAAGYDASRGGEPRAEAAAAAYGALLGAAAAGPVLDLACGTGLVTAAIRRRTERPVFGTDLSTGMSALASRRLPGRTIRSDAARLPFADAGLGVVTAVWLLHLLPVPTVAVVIAEVARVLVEGGRFLTTVDKNHAGPDAPDAESRVRALCTAEQLDFCDATTFVGHGQSRRGGPDPIYRVCAYVRQPRTDP